MSGCAADTQYTSLPADCDDDNPAITPGSMVCTDASSEVDVCLSDGTWETRGCNESFLQRRTCREQIDGTGVCL